MVGAVSLNELVALITTNFNQSTGRAEFVAMAKVTGKCDEGIELLLADGTPAIADYDDPEVKLFYRSVSTEKNGYNGVFQLLQKYRDAARVPTEYICREYEILFGEEFPI
ncbi:MAG: hypothetical protein AABW73_01340 [Nanoarchaeota archaeon]